MPEDMAPGLFTAEDGVPRCFWCAATPTYRHYHDTEWGFPVTDDRRLFEKICLEGFQAGLSWLTILNKREGFRRAFANFDATAVARFDEFVKHYCITSCRSGPSLLRFPRPNFGTGLIPAPQC